MTENIFLMVATTLLLTGASSFFFYWRGYRHGRQSMNQLRADYARLEKTANALAAANMTAQVDVALARMGLR
jgi:hypothetical protein